MGRLALGSGLRTPRRGSVRVRTPSVGRLESTVSGSVNFQMFALTAGGDVLGGEGNCPVGECPGGICPRGKCPTLGGRTDGQAIYAYAALC